MDHFERPMPVARKFITPGVIVLLLLAANGLVFLAGRFLFGIGSVTHLNNQYPWGIWIGIDVAAGVALAAGGFTTAALGHVMHREQYHSVTRPALLTAMLGYTLVAVGVSIDIGRYYYIWHPLIMWNGNSALFEVGICVMIYMTVLYIEFLPLVTERFIGHVNLPGYCSRNSTRRVDRMLRCLDRTLCHHDVHLHHCRCGPLDAAPVVARHPDDRRRPEDSPALADAGPAAALPALGCVGRLPDGHLRVAAGGPVVRFQARDARSVESRPHDCAAARRVPRLQARRHVHPGDLCLPEDR